MTTTEPRFTEKQLSVGKEEFERRLAGLREYAYSDAHPVLTRSIQWEVAYVDGLLAEVGHLRVAASILQKLAPYITDTHTGRLLLTTAWLDDFTNAEIDYLAAEIDYLARRAAECALIEGPPA